MTQASVFRHLKKSLITFIVIASLLGSTLGSVDVHAAAGDVALVAGSISVYPADIYQNDEVQVNLTVVNDGDTDLEDVGVALYVNTPDNPVATQSVDLAAGEQRNLTLYWVASEIGNHTLLALVDYNDEITETNEDNNMGSLAVEVQKPTYPPFPPARRDAVWWKPDWHYRVPVTVQRESRREDFVYEDKTVRRTFDFTGLMDVIKRNQTAGTYPTGAFDPDSVRVVAYARENETWYPEGSVGHELIFSDDYDAEDNANVTVTWVLDGATSPHEMRHYYVYWDTAGNGDISGAYGDITAGVKNAEFDGGSTGWKNNSEPTVGVPIPGFDDLSTWRLSTSASPTDPSDTCYRVYRRGTIWQEGWYGKVYQHFTVPDGGDASRYMLHADVYFNETELDGVEWELTLDGQTVESGTVTGGWQSIDADVTTYVADKGTATVAFRVYVTSLDAKLLADVAGYLDGCWLEVTPNPNVSVLAGQAHGWWGQIADGEIDGMPVDQPPTYAAGVSGMNTIESVNVSAVAAPREVMATIQYPAPRNTIAKKSIPLPDAGFETGDAYTTLFYSNEQTTEAAFSSVSHSGNQAVELLMSDYTGKYKMLDEPVSPDDMVGFRQELSQTILMSHLPSLWVWYRVDGYTAQSTLDVTLMTSGSPDRTHTIAMSELTSDGGWHRYVIDESTLDEWRAGAGTLTGIEVRLTANAESGENTLYLDDLGYAFMPGQGGTDRRHWHLPDFYMFDAAAETGMWNLRVTMTDSAGYRVTNVTSISVKPAANLNVEDISAPADVQEGETAPVTVTVANTGRKDVAASPPVNVSLSISQGDENVKMVKDLGALPADATKNLTFTWRASYDVPAEQGRWEIRADVNKDAVIPETNKGDNWNVQFIDVTPRPDLELHMYDIGFTLLHPDVNETVNVSVMLHNTGYQNTTATLHVYVREQDADRYTLIPNGTVEQIIGRRTNETVFVSWTPPGNGTYAVKVAASCQEESRTSNNHGVKYIRVGGPPDGSPPSITNIRISNETRFMGDPLNISANIRDNETTIDEAVVVISSDGAPSMSRRMSRLGDTSIFYYNASYSTVGYYSCTIEAYDTGGDGTGRRNRAVSDSVPFRIVHAGVETTPPSISGVAAVPERQVIGEPVNVSAAIRDDHPLEKVTLHVTGPTGTSTYTMTGGSGSYHYERVYETPGEYSCYVTAVDASANHNKNDTDSHPISFLIPADYDSDGISDTIEREAGANPRERGDNVNVSVGGARGYLLKKMDTGRYVYWDCEDGQLRSVKTDVIGGAKAILFDADGDGEYDHYYEEENGGILTYSPPAKADTGAVIWAVPAAILFALVCIMFVFIRRRASHD